MLYVQTVALFWICPNCSLFPFAWVMCQFILRILCRRSDHSFPFDTSVTSHGWESSVQNTINIKAGHFTLNCHVPSFATLNTSPFLAIYVQALSILENRIFFFWFQTFAVFWVLHFTFGWTPGVWILCDDVSEHSVPYIYIYICSPTKCTKCFNEWVLFSTYVSSTCFGPHRSIIRRVFYKLYLQIWYVVIQLAQNAPDDGPMRSETCRANISAE